VSDSLEGDKLELERQKWSADVELRKAGLEVSRQEQATKQGELELKRAELARSKWNSPLVVGIMAAALAGVANAAVTGINDYLQRTTEREKSEDGRILEMIKTGDTKTAANNLQFLADTGLITAPDRLKRLKDYLASHPNSGPVLPSGPDRFGFEKTPSLTGELAAALQASLNLYIAYFDQLEFSKPTTKVSVRVDTSKNMKDGWLSYYDPGANEIVIDSSIAADIDNVRREYSHYVLIKNGHGNYDDAALWRIESSLADYFVCSFADRPEFGSKVAAVLKLSTPYLKTLDNHLIYTPIAGSLQQGDNEALANGSTMWGGAFWAIRARLGQNVTDHLLATVWRAAFATNGSADQAFAAALLKAAGDKATVVRAILEDRKIPTHG